MFIASIAKEFIWDVSNFSWKFILVSENLQHLGVLVDILTYNEDICAQVWILSSIWQFHVKNDPRHFVTMATHNLSFWFFEILSPEVLKIASRANSEKFSHRGWYAL